MVVGAEARGAWGYAPPGSPFSLDLPGPSGPHDGFWLPCPLAMDTTHPCSWPLLGGSEGGGSGGGGSSPGSSSCRGAGDFDVSFGPPVPSGGPPRTTLPPAGISSGGVPGFMISTPSTLSPHASSCPSSVHRLNSSQSSPSWASVSTYTPSLVPSGSMVMPRPEWTFTRMPSSRTAMTTPSTTQMSEVPSSLTRTAKAVPFTEAVAVGVSTSNRLCESVRCVTRLNVFPPDCVPTMSLDDPCEVSSSSVNSVSKSRRVTLPSKYSISARPSDAV